MAQRLSFARPALLLLLVSLLCGCKPRPKSTAVTVRTLRNLSSLYGSEMDRRILEFQGSNPRLKSGQPIIIQSDTSDYKDMLGKQTSSSDELDLIILDSPDDVAGHPALAIDLPQATNVCAGLKACPSNIPAIIPPQITGNHREAAQEFVDFLQKAPSS